MDIIHVLPDSVADQIAAGEVVQRPCSCLKELVENALDAGAKHITIDVKADGRDFLQVIDDGCGMSVRDARACFTKHATSKIACAKDLFALHTMGFRGEALASICAVAHVEMSTRRAEDELGTYIEVSNSLVTKQEPCQCAVGTVIRIKDLFYNIPVRRTFLRSPQYETDKMLEAFYRMVLTHEDIHFTYVLNGNTYLDYRPSTEVQRIENVFGGGKTPPFMENFIPFETTLGDVHIHGYVEQPDKALGKTSRQFFFVNGRFMIHQHFRKTIIGIYENLLRASVTPSYFIYFTVPPETIDVNIHPTKTEIKFNNENDIEELLTATIKKSLGQFSLTTTIDYSDPEIPLTSTTPTTTPADKVLHPYASYSPERVFNPFKNVRDQIRTSSPVEYPLPLIDFTPDEDTPDTITFNEGTSTLPVDIENLLYHDGYIYIPMSEGILIISQRRAHITVLYHQLLGQLLETPIKPQQLLFPITLHLTADETLRLQEIAPELTDVGFIIVPEKDTLMVRAIPSALNEAQAQELLRDMLEYFKERPFDVTTNRQQIASLLASKVVNVKAPLMSSEECKELVRLLFSIEDNRYAPDGKKVMLFLSDKEIDHKFI